MSTETVKKTKAPAKPKKAVKTEQAEAGSAGQVELNGKTGTPAKAKTATKKTRTAAKPVVSRTPSHAEIAQLAERYWAERGWQDGQAEQDWLRAEQELTRAAS